MVGDVMALQPVRVIIVDDQDPFPRAAVAVVGMTESAGGGDSAGVFIGIGRAADVDAYLAGVGVDQITTLDVTPPELAVTRQPGAAAAKPPTEQSFWVAAASARNSADLSWPVQNGDYRMVIMNVDGEPNVIVQARVQLLLPNAFRISLAILACGVIIVAGGVALLIGGPSRRDRHRALR